MDVEPHLLDSGPASWSGRRSGGFFLPALAFAGRSFAGGLSAAALDTGDAGTGQSYDQVLHRNFYLAYLVFSFCALAVYLFHQTTFPTVPYVVCLPADGFRLRPFLEPGKTWTA